MWIPYLTFSWEWFTKMPSVCRLDQTSSDVFLLYSCLVHTWWTTSEQWTLGEFSWFPCEIGHPVRNTVVQPKQTQNGSYVWSSSSIKCQPILFIIHALLTRLLRSTPRTVRIGRTRERSIFISSLHPLMLHKISFSTINQKFNYAHDSITPLRLLVFSGDGGFL